MSEDIEEGFMAFLSEGREGIGAIREVSGTSLVVYVENRGEFHVPRSAVRSVHDQKVILDQRLLGRAVVKAIQHAHDNEDPKLAG